jgi:AraC-like DNA-binding protein
VHVNKDLGTLIQRAELDIVDFGHEIRSEMSGIGRKFPYYVMSYLKKGEALLRIGGRDIVTPAGSVILVRSGELHDHVMVRREDAVFLWWHFNFMISKHVDMLRLFDLPVMVQIKNTAAFEKLFLDYLAEINKTQTVPGLIYMKARALDVLACLLENFISSEKDTVSTSIPQNFLGMLEDLTGRPDAGMSLKKLTEKYHLNPTYISNKFQEYFGQSPIVLHRKVMIEAAKERLLVSSENIGDIAAEFGFRDTSAFTRFFTKIAGISPSAYRNSR